MDRFHTFTPQLIIEATAGCDRNCPGCYAANRFLKGKPSILFKKYPELFLNPSFLAEALTALSKQVGSKFDVLSFRGGEPSLHPLLIDLLKIARSVSDRIYLETHGRWALNGDDTHLREVLRACTITDTIVKVSFDQMHGMSVLELKTITELLDRNSVNWVVAITEVTVEETKRTQELCFWVPSEKIILQSKIGLY